MAGRYPKPTKLKLLEGNPGRRPLPDEPEFRATTADPPPHLDPYGLEEWNRVAPSLVDHGILTEPDRAALEAYCRWFALWRRCMIDVESKRLKGRAYQQALATARDASKEMRAFQVQCGITPATHSRVKARPTETKDEYAAFRKKK